MSAIDATEILLYTAVTAPQHVSRVHLLVESLRAFGGPLADSPIWVFQALPQDIRFTSASSGDVAILPLAVSETLRDAWYAGKVSACARAEELATGQFQTMVWLAPDCLILQPPTKFRLDHSIDAAVRPVHHRNVGLPADAKVDAFWRRVYREVGIEDLSMRVLSFVEEEPLRAYFNTHAFALNPERGICRRWLRIFEALVLDDAFMAGPCRDLPHRIFLHQAPFSPLIADTLGSEAIEMLPPTYSYPYNLQDQIPEGRRARALNDLISIAYEDRSLEPSRITDIAVHEPLDAWLAARVG